MFVRNFYIRIGEDRLRVDSPGHTPGFDDLPVVAVRNDKIEAFGRAADALKNQANIKLIRPFSHERTVISDFAVALKLLTLAIRQLLQRAPGFHLWVRVIMHPQHSFAGELTEDERRAFRTLATSLGARTVAIYTGRELTPDEIKTFDFKRANQALQPTPSPSGLGRG